MACGVQPFRPDGRLVCSRWTYSSNSLLTLLKDRLEPILNEARPSIVGELWRRVDGAGGSQGSRWFHCFTA